jgi:molybdopterin synthase sulfur carrier subunit
MTEVTFELFASLARLAGATELRVAVPVDARTIADAIAALAEQRPELAAAVDRCACVSGDAIVKRACALPADGRIALLPPVAGG